MAKQFKIKHGLVVDEGGANITGSLLVSGSYLQNGADNNSGKADFAVKTGGSPTVSLRDGQVQVGANDMNFEGKLSVDASNFTMDSWAKDIRIRTQTSSTTQNIKFYTALSGTTSERMRIAGNGYVGIGTTSPTYPLHLVSENNDTAMRITQQNSTGYAPASILLQATSQGQRGQGIHMHNSVSQTNWFAGTLYADDNQGYGVAYYPNASFQSQTAQTVHTRFYVSSSGNVGIGTTSPSEKLHVFGGAAAIEIDSTTNEASLKYDNSTTTAVIKLANNDLKTELGGSEVMRILANGNVGIGTTSPSNKLQVEGSFNVGQVGYGQFGFSSGAGIRIFGTQNSANGYDGFVGRNLTYDSTTSEYRYISTNANNVWGTVAGMRVIGYNNGGQALAFIARPATQEGTNIEATDLADYTRLSIKYDGNVGIGTTSPDYKLTVSNGTVGSEYTTVNNHLSRRVDLTPANASGLGAFTYYNTNTASTPDFMGKYGYTFYGGTSTAAKQFQVFVGDAVNPRMVVRADSRVGIGTTAPTEELHVVGEAIFQGPTYSMSFLNGSDVRGSNQLLLRADASYLKLQSTNNSIFHQAGVSHIFLDAAGSEIVTIDQDGRLDVASDLRLRGSSATANLGVVRLYVGGDDSLTINPANDGVSQFKFFPNGDMIVPGKLTAQEFHTEYVSASIVYQSGSTKFGDTADDVHAFTGSLDVFYPSTYGAKINLRTSLHKWTLEGGETGYSANSLALDFNGNTFIRMLGTSEVRIGAGVSVGSMGYVAPTNGLYVHGNTGLGTLTPQAKLHISGTSDVLLVEGSGSTLMDVQGSQGQLFSVVDSLSGSLMSVNDVSGLPIMEVFSDDKVVMGEYGTNALVVTGSRVGIGTDAPIATMDVREASGTSTNPIPLQTWHGGNVGNNIVGKMEYTQDAGVFSIGYAGISGYDSIVLNGGTSNAGSSVALRNDGSTTISLHSNQASYFNGGNVGIGTNSPGATLDIQSPVGGQSTLVKIKANNSAAEPMLEIANSANTLGKIGGVNGGGLRFTTLNNAEALRIKSDGNVGIGTTNPAHKLQVEGGIKVGSDAGTNLDFANAGILIRGSAAGNNSYIVFEQQGVANWRVVNRATSGNFEILNGSLAGQERLSITNAGNVGIGTTTPSEKLDVEGHIRIGVNHRFQIWNDNVGLYRDSNDLRLAGYGSIQFLSSTTGMTGQVERMRITNTGNVGIGTTSPAKKLDVAGTIRGWGAGATSLANSTSGAAFQTEYSGNPSIGVLSIGTLVVNGGNTTHYLQAANTAGTIAKDIVLNPYGGDVGIGTTAPSYNLEVSGSSVATLGIISNNEGKAYLRMHTHTNEGIYFEADDGATNHLYIRNAGDNAHLMAIDRSTGNVGIGTASPTKTLDVRGTSIISGSFSGADAYALTLVNTDSSGNPGIMRMTFPGEGGNEALQIGMFSSPTTKPVYFQSTQGSGWGNVVFQPYGGNVGIGTNLPTQKLHVNGNVSASLYYGDGENLTNVQRIPKVEYLQLTGSITTNDELTLPNGLEYTPSSNGFEYLEVFMDGIRLNRTIDYAEVDPTTVRYLLNVPSGSVITYKSLTLV